MRLRALRQLPARLPGKLRLAQAFLRKIQAREDVLIESLSGARFFVPHLSEPLAFHLLVNGCYEPETDNFILGHLKPGDAFIDAGANIGLFAVSAARKVGAEGRVVAIEPSPTVFRYLQRNVESNLLDNVTAMRVAASDENREAAPFYAAPMDHFGMGALAPQFHHEPCVVKTRTLDDILTASKLRRVAVLKVDVEGHEAAVFRGAKELLVNSPAPAIIFEFCDWAEARFQGGYPGQAQEFLMSLGYSIWLLADHGYRGRPLKTPLTRGSAMLVAERSI